jgi:hypothetical protein
MQGKSAIDEDPNSLPSITKPGKKTLDRVLTTASKGKDLIICECDGTLKAIAKCLADSDVLFEEMGKQIALLQNEAKTGSGMKEKRAIEKLEEIMQARQKCPRIGLIRIGNTV